MDRLPRRAGFAGIVAPPVEATYREHLPSADLAPWVECFWRRAVSPGGAHAVLPDGCADVIFDLTDGGADGFVVGPMTRAVRVGPIDGARYLGVRFRPGGAGAFLGVPLGSLVDRRVELSALWKDAAFQGERIAEAGAAGRLVDAMQDVLRERLRASDPPPPRLRALIRDLAAAPETVSVAALAERAGITRQHLTRLFQHEVGYGPKKLARILRLRRAVRLLETRGRGVLAEVALDAGYYDQSHMNADFRDLAGASPLRLGR